MMIIPLILIVAGFILYSKKFKIDEEFYQQIITDLATKKPKKKKKTHKRK